MKNNRDKNGRFAKKEMSNQAQSVGSRKNGKVVKRPIHEQVTEALSVIFGEAEMDKMRVPKPGHFVRADLNKKEIFIETIKSELNKYLKFIKNCANDGSLKLLKKDIINTSDGFLNKLKEFDLTDRQEIANKINSFVDKTDQAYGIKLEEFIIGAKKASYNNLMGEQLKNALIKKSNKMERPIIDIKRCGVSDYNNKNSLFKLKDEEVLDMEQFIDKKINKNKTKKILKDPLLNVKEQFEVLDNAIASATKKFWQAKRELMIVNKILEKTYSDEAQLSDADKDILNTLIDKTISDNSLKIK